MDPLNHAKARTAVMPSGLAHASTTPEQVSTPGTAAASTADRAMSADAEQVPANVRLTVLRQALSNACTSAAALVDLAAELRHAAAPGLAWDSDYLADQIDALAGAIALLLKTAEEPIEPSDQRAAHQPGRAD